MDCFHVFEHIVYMPVCVMQVGAIILTPTRELAFQISEVVTHFLKHFSQFSALLIIGGSSPQQDIAKFVNNGYVCASFVTIFSLQRSSASQLVPPHSMNEWINQFSFSLSPHILMSMVIDQLRIEIKILFLSFPLFTFLSLSLTQACRHTQLWLSYFCVAWF